MQSKYHGLTRLLSFIILFQVQALLFAQSLRRKVSLSGDLRVELKYDGIRGKQQGRPRWIQTITFKPNIIIPKLPALNFLLKLSSLEETIRQPFNRINLHVSKKWGVFYLGDAYPVFSKYSLNGILVRGASFDVQPGPFRLALAVGQTKRAIKSAERVQIPSFSQILYGIKIGVGKKSGSRLNLNLIKAKDDPHSLQSFGNKKPQDNVVVGLNGSLKLFKDKFNLTGEIAGSAFTRDTRSPRIKIPRKIPSFATRIFKPRISSQYDLACFLDSKISFSNSTFRGNFRHIGSAFYSLGTPYLHNDIRGYGLGFTQRLWTNKIYLNTGVDRSRDNLDGLKSSTTITTSGHANANITLKKIPSSH